MMIRTDSFSEEQLHIYWEHQITAHPFLTTTDGRTVIVLNPGLLNKTDGPDFLEASILLDGVVLHGAIELHKRSQDWYHHRHHTDERYNKVILHVVAERRSKAVFTQQGIKLPTLSLLPLLSQPLREKTPLFPCTSFTRISDYVIEQQLFKAQIDYLEAKCDAFIQHYDASLTLEAAWKRALFLSICDGLGISQNRSQMLALGCFAWKEREVSRSATNLSERVDAFCQQFIRWNTRAVRPQNQPSIRIPQSLAILEHLSDTPLTSFYTQPTEELSHTLFSPLGKQKTHRYMLLQGTVLLPAIYVLAQLLGKSDLQDRIRLEWENLSLPIPDAVLRSGPSVFSGHTHQWSLGLLHQIRSTCSSGHCSSCLIFKSAI
ncbi:MAG: DUF2851 family protein [Bacteroidota bacterium]